MIASLTKRTALPSIFLACFSLNVLAANSSGIVTVQATMPLASEPGNNPAIFTFSRDGNTNAALAISFEISGTATNAVDYAAVSNSIYLAAGQTSTNVIITPTAEPSASGYKTVVLTLPRHLDGEPLSNANYRVGSLNKAVAYIAYNYTNIPPTVSIVDPTNAQTFLSLPNIEIAATASDSNGWVTTVAFLANGKTLGVVSNNPFGNRLANSLILRESHRSIVPVWLGSHVSRYQFVWTNVIAGNYALTAVATDNAGLQTISSAVNISVSTNLPAPTVRIASPADGAVFPDLANINIYAAATEDGGVVNTVEFLANGRSLGVATNYLAAEPSSEFHLRTRWLPFSFRWTNAPIGSNILTAIATDNNGTQAVSDPVNITVSTNAFHFHPGR
jgi:hypothetical protein